jgi:hypothetical protein
VPGLQKISHIMFSVMQVFRWDHRSTAF